MSTTTISTKGGFGSYTVHVNGEFAGHVSESKKDGKFVAIRSGVVLGRYTSKVEAVGSVASKGGTK
jgi:hypothetical protein